jgi:hypothetical protein
VAAVPRRTTPSLAMAAEHEPRGLPAILRRLMFGGR